MLANAAIVEAVAAAVADLEVPFLVVDPVMVAKSGDRLIDDEALGAFRTELLSHAYLVTPNIAEAEALAGMTIVSDEDRREAARRIAAIGAVGRAHQGRTSSRLRTSATCCSTVTSSSSSATPASRAATRTAPVAPLPRQSPRSWRSASPSREAIPLAQRYVAEAIRHAPGLGRGHGPMDHFWDLTKLP